MKIISILIYFIIWNIVGSLVLTLIDDKENSLLIWASKAPFGLSYIIVFFWPIIFVFWIRNKVKK